MSLIQSQRNSSSYSIQGATQSVIPREVALQKSGQLIGINENTKYQIAVYLGRREILNE